MESLRKRFIFLFVVLLLNNDAIIVRGRGHEHESQQPNPQQIYHAGPFNTTFPLVTNTWPWLEATNAGWNELMKTNSSLNAIIAGCSKCEELQCDHTVGYGGSPDTIGETTLDAMIMYGPTHDAGSVGDLRRIKDAIKVARAVMDYTDHTLLVGESATNFAIEMGFDETNLTTNYSIAQYESWLNSNCQPNYYKNCINDTVSCPPYKPNNENNLCLQKQKNIENNKKRFDNIPNINTLNHDTIGMIAIEYDGTISIGTTTNGANHKIAGRVGDSPIIGSGGYVEHGVGAAVATGDGDIMMRFAPTKEAVFLMKYKHLTPTQACIESLLNIAKYYSTYQGAMVCVSANGTFGAASYGWSNFFQFGIRDITMNQTMIFLVNSTTL